jgi:hypothetical protein
MSLKTIDDLFLKKTHDTIVIYGSGPSINKLTEDDFKILNRYNSMSFNMTCKTQIPVDIYIVGEILDHYWKSLDHPEGYEADEAKDIKISKEDSDSYFKLLNHKAFNNTFMVLWDTPSIMKRKDIIYNNLPQDKMHLQTICRGCGPNYVDKNFYTPDNLKQSKVLLHQNVGLNACIFLAKSMGFKKIIFSGVDLNNYEYAFDRNYFRKHLIREDVTTCHRSWKHVFSFINYLKNDIQFEVYNSDSKLTEIIPVFDKNSINN